MSVTSPVTGRVTSPVVSRVTVGRRRRVISDFDSDAQDYFSRAEALGGSFDLTAISGTYTEAYVKTAISDYVAGCKTDSIWTKLTEIYLLSGVTFGGLMAKLKHAGTAVTTNLGPFVTGDYVAAGSGAGLVGNGSSKYINCNAVISQPNNFSIGVYIVTAGTGAFSVYMGSRGPSSNPRFEFGIDGTVTSMRHFFPIADAEMTVANQNVPGFASASRRSTSDIEAYKNGVSIATDTSSASVSETTDLVMFAALTPPSTISGFVNGRMSFGFLSQGLTTAETANLSNRVNALMTALGANVY